MTVWSHRSPGCRRRTAAACLAGLLLAAAAFAHEPAAPVPPENDGPYVFRAPDGQLESLWLCDGDVVRLL